MRNPQEPQDGVGGHLDAKSLSECAYSPQQATPAALEHAAGCAACSTWIEELRTVLGALAALPEPEVPASVLAQLDETLALAWQEADQASGRADMVDEAVPGSAAPQSSGAGTAVPRQSHRPAVAGSTAAGPALPPSATPHAASRQPASRQPASSRSVAARPGRPRLTWRRLRVPISTLGVVAGAVAGIVVLVTHGGTPTATSVTSAAGSAPTFRSYSSADLTLTRMVQAALADSTFGAAARNNGTVAVPSTPKASPHPMATCFRAPALAGYSVVGSAPESTSGVDSSLVIYRDANEPASSTALYAVLYAGSCPDSSSAVLDQGLVSLSR